MKAFLPFFVASLLFGFSAKAQITVSQSDMPQAGDTVRLSTDNTSTGLPDPTLTGPSYTWDYTKLVPYTQTIDTFLSVTSTPFAYQLYFNDGFLYPNYKATVAQDAPNLPAIGPVTITDVIDFYKASSSDYEDVGFGSSINSLPTSVKDDTIDIMYHFPMNYGNADSCHSSFHMSIPSLAYYGGRQYRVNHVDGWGTLKTPFGTFNTLRVTTEWFVTDSLYIDTLHFGFAVPQPEQLQYKWFGKGSKLPLLQVNETYIGKSPVFTSAVYQDSIRYTILGVAQVNAQNNNVTVYPNPSKGVFTFAVNSGTLKTNNTIEIYNILGEKVYSSLMPQTSKGALSLVDLSSQSNGVYFYRITSATGNLVGEGKVSKQ